MVISTSRSLIFGTWDKSVSSGLAFYDDPDGLFFSLLLFDGVV